MKICPKCKVEYREEFHICSDCNVDLVDGILDEKVNREYHKVNWVYLTSVSHDKLYIYLSLLDSNNIPTITKERETGDYLKIYMGVNSFGTDIFVPEENIEDGVNIIKGIEDREIREEEFEEEYYEDEINYDKYIKKRKILKRIFLGIIFIPSIVIFILSKIFI